MFRLLFLVLGFSVIVAGFVYMGLAWWSAPHRKLLRRYRRMRELILEEVDASERSRARRLLEDCEDHLRGLIRARQRLDALDDMAEAAAEFAELDRPIDRDQLESRLRDDVQYFVGEMSRISAEVDYDWRESMRRLEDFADELERKREVFAQLEDLSER